MEDSIMKTFLTITSGLFLMVVTGFPINPSFSPNAVKKYKAKADEGDAEAQYLYSTALANGVGVTKNKTEAFVYAKKAVSQRYKRALRRLGLGYEEGWENTSDAVKAAKCYSIFVNWAKKVADEGDADAQYNLGVCYKYGKGVEKDETEAIKWIRKAAEQGYAMAQCNLGVCYKDGTGVEMNGTEAVKWYRKAAEQGYAMAQCNLGRCYEYGKGVKKDETEAVKWYRKAAEQGYAKAQYLLGMLYKYGVKKDETEAVRWFHKAAKQGDMNAQFHLGLCKASGTGVEKDESEAVKWFRKAAEQDDADAQCDLGACYYNGTGVEKDETEAMKWFRKAAEQGVADAQRNLGICYEYGKGVEKNISEAVKWYRKAAEQGNANAKEKLTDMGLVSVKDVRAEFNGVKFAENISKYGEAECQDNSDDQRLMEITGAHKVSFQYIKYHPKKQFRMFSVGEIRASWKSGVIYEVNYKYSFDRNKSTAVDREEVKQTLAALTRKYGPARSSSPPDALNNHIMNDVFKEFRSGDMIVTLKYTSGGRFGRGSMVLTAYCPVLKKLAELESRKHYEKRAADEASNVKAGGEDTL